MKYFIALLFIGHLAYAEPTGHLKTNIPDSGNPNGGIPGNQSLGYAQDQINQGMNGSFNGAAFYKGKVDAAVEAMKVEAQQQINAIRAEASKPFVPPPKHEVRPVEKYSVEKAIHEKSSQIESKRQINVRAIPDPTSIPYRFESSGSNRVELERLYKDLYKIEPKFGKQIKAKELGLESVQAADQFYAEGSNAEGKFLKELARDFLDIAVGIDPVSGFGRSVYELCYGRNLITGATLTTAERGFAFLGVASVGTGRTLAQTTRALTKVYHGATGLLKERQAIQTAIAHAEPLAEKAGQVLHKWQKNFKITSIEAAEEMNQRLKYAKPPFQEGSHVVHFETAAESKFVRVSGHKNRFGPWLVREGEIKGLTPPQIADKLNLPTIPTHIEDIVVPAKFPMARGMTNLNQWEGVASRLEGQVQFRAMKDIPGESFRNYRKIGDRL